MKSVYWRPQKLSASMSLLIGVGAILSLALVELTPRYTSAVLQEEKTAANQLAELCRLQIRHARECRGLEPNRFFDPSETGLVGSAMTSITSKPASLEAKQLALHPHFPSAIVQLLNDAGVRRGDMVAVGWTGSFPGLNVALASAMETLEIRPVIIASVTASQYGANEPEFTWLDMESALHQAGLIHYESGAATIGGPGDCGMGMSDQSKQDAVTAMRRNQVRQLKAKRLSKSIDSRMRFLQSKSEGHRIAAYINVGGGAASCGGRDCVFQAGLNDQKVKSPVDCLMQRFHERGVPVIHLAHPKALAKRCRVNPRTWHTASISSIPKSSPSRVAALAVFVSICCVLRAFVLRDDGHKFLLRVGQRLRDRPVLRIVGDTNGPQLMA